MKWSTRWFWLLMACTVGLMAFGCMGGMPDGMTAEDVEFCSAHSDDCATQVCADAMVGYVPITQADQQQAPEKAGLHQQWIQCIASSGSGGHCTGKVENACYLTGDLDQKQGDVLQTHDNIRPSDWAFTKLE